MLAILTITTPIFLLIGLGFFSVRFGWLQQEHLQGLGAFVIRFALPALIYTALASKPINDIINPIYLTAYGGGSLLSYTLGFLLTRIWRKQDWSTATLNGFGMGISNSGFIGYSVLVMVLGQTAGVYLALNVIVENLLIIPLFLILAELAQPHESNLAKTFLHIGATLVRNPMVAALILGLLVSITGLKLPTPLTHAISMLAQASAPVALFVIGGSLFGVRLGHNKWDMLVISSGKLLIHPLLVLALFLLLPHDNTLAVLCGVLLATAPMASIFPIMGQRFGQEQRCAAILMSATLMSFFSMSFMLLIWHTWFANTLPQ